MVTANVAGVAAVVSSFVFSLRFDALPVVETLFWLAVGAAVFHLLLSRLVVEDGWPTRASSSAGRILAVVWMFVPAGILAVRPVDAGWDFSYCGTLVGREPAARHPSANPELERFATACDAAYAHRWIAVAVAVAVTVAVAWLFLWWSRRRRSLP